MTGVRRARPTPGAFTAQDVTQDALSLPHARRGNERRANYEDAPLRWAAGGDLPRVLQRDD